MPSPSIKGLQGGHAPEIQIPHSMFSYPSVHEQLSRSPETLIPQSMNTYARQDVTGGLPCGLIPPSVQRGRDKSEWTCPYRDRSQRFCIPCVPP